MLDIRTLFFSAAVLSFLFTTFLFAQWLVYGRRRAGSGLWSAGALISTVGATLFLLRDFSPALFSIVAANSLVLFSLAVSNHGLLVFDGRKMGILGAGPYLVACLALAVIFWFSLVVPNLMVRIVLVSAFISVNHVFLIVAALTGGKPDLPRFLMAGPLAFGALLMLLRIPLTLLGPDQTDFMQAGLIQAINVFVWMLTMPGISVGVSLLLSRRLLDEQRRLAESNELLVREMHHRIKNNLAVIQSLLSLQSSQADGSETREALRDSSLRVAGISLIHELLYKSRTLDSIRLDEYLRSLAVQLVKNFSTAAIDLRLELEPVSVDLNTVIPCGLLVNELLTNACKYAFRGRSAGRLRLAMSEAPSVEGAPPRVRIEVADDGVGLPESGETGRSGGLGFQIIESLRAQLGAELEIMRGAGTRFVLVFPAKR